MKDEVNTFIFLKCNMNKSFHYDQENAVEKGNVSVI